MNASTSQAALAPTSAQATGLHWVAVYLIHELPRPEESAWTHIEGELITDPELYAEAGLPPAAFLDEAAAWAYARRLEDALAPLNRRRPPRHSVLSRGTYEALVMEGATPPLQFPHVPPQYE